MGRILGWRFFKSPYKIEKKQNAEKPRNISAPTTVALFLLA